MSFRIRSLGRWLASAALALLLAACVRVDMELEVSPENTVSGSAILAVDDSLLELSGQTADDLFRDMETTADLPEGASVEPYEEDGFVGQRITFEDVALAEFSQGGVAASGEQLSITRQGDEFRVNGRLDMTGSEFGGSEVPQQFLDSIEFRIAITFPGRVSSATGAIDGNTVTWTPQVGQNTEIRAVASAIPSGPSLLPFLLIAAVVILAIVTFVVVRRRHTAAPVAAGATAGWPEPPTHTAGAPADPAVGLTTPTPPPPPSAPPIGAEGSTANGDDATAIDRAMTADDDGTHHVRPGDDAREDAREDDATPPPVPPVAD